MSEDTGEQKPKYASAKEEIEAIELQIKRAQLEDVELQKQERAYSLKDLKARLGERDVKELQKKEDREAQGRTFAVQKATDDIRQRACTHRKGGVVTPRDMRVLHTGGNGQQYAIFKHQMINGDVWVRCLRCGKTWAPPVEENFYFDAKGKQVAVKDGKFDKAKFDAITVEYHNALKFETNNSMSASVQCRFSKYDLESGKIVDAADDIRKDLANTNLR